TFADFLRGSHPESLIEQVLQGGNSPEGGCTAPVRTWVNVRISTSFNRSLRSSRTRLNSHSGAVSGLSSYSSGFVASTLPADSNARRHSTIILACSSGESGLPIQGPSSKWY